MNSRPPSIPFSIIRELRCRNCQNVLSCGPVYVIPDECVLCGRCKHFAKDIFRNTSFEALASMFVYPCKHWENHCPRILQWDECFLHEERCSYDSGCGLFWKHPKAFLKGKREMPFGDIRLIPIPEKLLDYIKCIQCESYLSCEPVYIRSDGKNICHRCIHSNGVPEDCIRNVAYEVLSNIIIFPCVFRNRGCPTRLKFGTDLWHHEAECSYNQMFKKQQQTNGNQKKRGVIETHSGHYYGTITPHSAPFAPPLPNTEFDINQQLVKSFKKQQERKLLRAEEIGSNIIKMNSEDGSSDRDSEKENSYDKNRSSEESSGSTPTRLDEPNYSQLTPQTPNSIQIDQQESRQLTPVFLNSPKDFLHFDYNFKPAIENNYYQNLYMAQVHQGSDSASQNSHTSSPTKGNYDDNFENMKRLSRNNSYNQNGYYEPGLRSPSILKTPLQEMDYNPLDGLSPVYINPYGQGLIPKPSFKGVVRTDSLSSNRELINELKAKQKLKKTTEKKEADNPYKECNNLEEILQVHDKIGE